ncbi:MAG: tRNA (adenosine(37)-N6)-threonylcarbamoyltransferase complex ATPase subunit type 1 TsaE, partial [Patescibacteria group bacterium]
MKTRKVTLVELQALAHSFAQKSSPLGKRAKIVGLIGELGAGKTAFVKEVAHLLGVKDTLTSPTFVIEKIYPLKGKQFKKLIHIDAYRLSEGKELTA